MSEQKPLVNRVAASGLVTIDLEKYFPADETAVFDIKDYLFKGLILREKDFRAAVKEHDWAAYQDKVLLVYCSTNAIIPMWAYMLIAVNATPFAKDIFQGTLAEYQKQAFKETIRNLDIESFEGKRVIIKGCSDKPVPSSAYLDLTQRLQPKAKSIMFGEPCSTVPIYKRPK